GGVVVWRGEAVMAGGLERKAEVLLAPVANVSVSDVPEGGTKRVQTAVAHQRAECQNGAGHAVAAVQSLQAFVFADQRLEHLGAAEQPLAGPRRGRLLGRELEQLVHQAAAGVAGCPRLKPKIQARESSGVVLDLCWRALRPTSGCTILVEDLARGQHAVYSHCGRDSD